MQMNSWTMKELSCLAGDLDKKEKRTVKDAFPKAPLTAKYNISKSTSLLIVDTDPCQNQDRPAILPTQSCVVAKPVCSFSRLLEGTERHTTRHKASV